MENWGFICVENNFLHNDSRTLNSILHIDQVPSRMHPASHPGCIKLMTKKSHETDTKVKDKPLREFFESRKYCGPKYKYTSKYKIHINTAVVLPGYKARTYQVII